jgi:hypothetical protein
MSSPNWTPSLFPKRQEQKEGVETKEEEDQRDTRQDPNAKQRYGWPNLLVRPDLLVSDAMMMMAVNDTIEDKLVSPINSPR